jgi:hypothetical protein
MGDIWDAFVIGNANPKFITDHLADALRDLMRATAAKDDPVEAIMRAAKEWKFVLELLPHCKEPLTWEMLFEEAVKKLRPEEVKGDSVDRAIQKIARAGMSYYIENAPVAGKKHRQLMDAISYLEEARQHARDART